MWQVVLLAFISSTVASPAYQSQSLGEDGSYQFFYETGKDSGMQTRQESRGPDGVVVGKYSYEDPTGELRVVNYRADGFGYVAKGDVGVPGAPEAQVPAEPIRNEDDNGSEDSSTSEPPKSDEEDSGSESTGNDTDDDEDYEDDVKATKLQEPSNDGPPDGFPIGFFGQNFQGLRRLPEPTASEENTKASDDGETNQKTTDVPAAISDTESTKDQSGATSSFRFFPYHYHYHHPGAEPVSYMSEPLHPPYVYSYQHPDGYGYHYAF